MHAFLILLVTLASTVPAVRASRDDSKSVAFRLRDKSDIVVPVSIRGVGPFSFLLDTGASRSAVTDRVAEVLRLPRVGHTVVVTPAGQRIRPLVSAPFGLGDARMTLSAMVLASGDLGRGIDGMIGTDLLSTRRFTIDYVGRRLVFDVGDQLERGTSVSLTHGADGFVVTLPVRERGHPLRFIPDTGTAGFVLFARKGRALPRITPLASAPLRTVAGLKVGRAVLLEQLQIGSIQVREQPAVLITGSKVDERLGDGLLPLHLFARVTFDGPGGSLTIVPHR